MQLEVAAEPLAEQPHFDLNLMVEDVHLTALNDSLRGGGAGGGRQILYPAPDVCLRHVDYGWFFSEANDVEDTFDDGQFTWVVGVGFNF